MVDNKSSDDESTGDEEPSIKVLYDAVFQSLVHNGRMTATELDDAIYPLTAMNSQRINIAHCLDKLMDESIIHVITEEDNGRTLYYDLNSEHDESSISDESVDEVTGYNKKLDVKAYMLHMLMNHSNERSLKQPEWIREDKLFDTVKENFTGFEDETLKNILESLVNDNSVEVGDCFGRDIDSNLTPNERFYRYKKRELEGDDMVEKERDKTEEPFETALPIETSPQDDASDEASSE